MEQITSQWFRAKVNRTVKRWGRDSRLDEYFDWIHLCFRKLYSQPSDAVEVIVDCPFDYFV